MTKRQHIKEDKRYSIIQDDFTLTKYVGRCFSCKRYLREHEGAVHEVFGGNNRQKSMDYGLVVRLCFNHHDRQSPISVHRNPNGYLNKWLMSEAKQKFKEKYPQENFIDIFGREYEIFSE